MLARGDSRQYLKYTLYVARIKLLYEKITLTRFTALYFFSGLLVCIVLSSLQIASLVHDSEGVMNLSSVIAEYNRVAGIALMKGDTIELCSGLPDQPSTLCIDFINFKDPERELNVRADLSDSDDDSSDSEDDEFSDDESDDEDDVVNGEAESGVSTTTSSIALTVTASSTISPDSSTLTVISTPSSSRSTSSSILSSITSTQVLSTTSFTFSSTLSSPIPTSTTAVTSAISTSDRPRSTTTEPPGSPTIPGTSPARSEQASVTAISSAPGATSSPVSSKNDSVGLGDDCIVSLMWLNDVIHDAQREDVVIFVFQMWLFGLSFVTIVNESIPHLGAGLLGHLLGTAWAAYRVHSTHGLKDRYQNHIVPDACNGRDFMGDWWENRISDAIPLVALQAVTLILVSYLSFKLYNVYASQTYKRVGASSQVHSIYKLVLLFSVCLQLSGFMSVASAAMWIDKVSHGPLSGLARHAKLYLGAFIATLLIQIPWVFIGWIFVRRESRFKFVLFCLMSAFSFAISFAMFYSDLYRFLVATWPFFATMTIIAFILVVGTTILGVLCRLKFGKGLAHHLQHTELQDDDNFSPVYFTNSGKFHDIEKFGPTYEPKPLPTIAIPQDGTNYVEFPIPVHAPGPGTTRISSIYIDPQTTPGFYSSSNPMESGIIPVTRMSVFSKALKRFSLRAPSPSMKSVRTESWSIGNNDLPSGSIKSPLPVPTSDSAATYVMPTDQRLNPEVANATVPRMLIPPSPMETLSVYSFATHRQTMASEEVTIKTCNAVGLPSNPRQSSVSAYSFNSRKAGLPANPRQSTASVFPFTSASAGSAANPRESISSTFSFTTRSVGFPENPRQSTVSDTLPVKSRNVGLPTNPRSRVFSS